MKRFAFVLGLALMAATASTAQATIVYQYVADVQNVIGSAGTTSVTVSFYLQETVSGTDTSYIFKQHGLNAGGFQLDRLFGDGWVNSLANQTGAGGNFPGGLGGVTGNFATNTAGPWRATNTVSTTATSGPLGTVQGAVTTVLLGTGTFNLGTVTSTIKLGKKLTGVNTQSFTDKTNLDVDNAALNIQGAGDLTFNVNLGMTLSLPGDYNHDGVVDAADYTIWRDTLGSVTDLRANGDNSGASAGKIDQADYAFWQSHYGNHSGSGAAAAVPEPASLLLFLSGTLTICSRRWQLVRKLINA